MPSCIENGPPATSGRFGVAHHGVALAVTLTAGNAHDVTQLLPLVDAIPPLRGKPGRPRRRPRVLAADRGDAFDRYRRARRARGIRPPMSRRAVAQGSGLGRWRWVVECTLAWLHLQTAADPLAAPS
jgi:hypothetical protein